MEVCQTLLKALPAILLPCVPEHSASPLRTEVIKIHSSTYISIPLIPDNGKVNVSSGH
jgi:hypothetical protein